MDPEPKGSCEDSSNSLSTGTKRVLVGCTGSVAAIKLPALVQSLQEGHPEVGSYHIKPGGPRSCTKRTKSPTMHKEEKTLRACTQLCEI